MKDDNRSDETSSGFTENVSGLTGAADSFAKRKADVSVIFNGKLIDGRFLIEQLIGSGGAGTVFLATDNTTNEKVAVKVLGKHGSVDEASLRRFNQETRVTRYLRNPRIVKVYEYGVEDDHPFFVMEYLSGGSLKDRLSDGPLNESECAKILQQICEAVDFAHRQGVIHRDLKPNNIMFVDENRKEVKLLDFGVSRTTTWDIDNEVLNTDSTLFGTPLYFAPERIDGKDADERSDIYSLGCVVYECLTGVPPYVASSQIELFTLHKAGNVVPIRKTSAGANCSVEFESIVMRMLEKKPLNRFQKIADLLVALKKYDGSLDDRESTPESETSLDAPSAAELDLFGSEDQYKNSKDRTDKRVKNPERSEVVEASVQAPVTQRKRISIKDVWSNPGKSFALLGLSVLVAAVLAAVAYLRPQEMFSTERSVEGFVWHYKPSTKTKTGDLYLWVSNPDVETPGQLVKIVVPTNYNLDDLAGSATGTNIGDSWKIIYHNLGDKKILDDAKWTMEQLGGEDLRMITRWIAQMFGDLAVDKQDLDGDVIAAYFMPEWSVDNYKKLNDTWANITFNVVSDSRLFLAPRQTFKIESYDKDQGKAAVLVRTKYWIRTGPQYMRFVLVKKDNRKWLIAKVEEVSPSIWENDGALEPVDSVDSQSEDEQVE